MFLSSASQLRCDDFAGILLVVLLQVQLTDVGTGLADWQTSEVSLTGVKSQETSGLLMDLGLW